MIVVYLRRMPEVLYVCVYNREKGHPLGYSFTGWYCSHNCDGASL